MKRILAGVLFTSFAASLLAANDNDQENQRLKSAADVLQEIMGTPDKSIPNGLFHKAYCVIVDSEYEKGRICFFGKVRTRICFVSKQWSLECACRNAHRRRWIWFPDRCFGY